MIEKKICEYCKKEFESQHWAKRKYCSHKCRCLNDRRVRIKKVCKYCKKEFMVVPTKKNTAKYCSQKCRLLGRRELGRRTHELVTCKQCGKVFESYKSQKRVVCGIKCSNKYVSSLLQVKANQVSKDIVGENHPGWKGGLCRDKLDGNRTKIRINGKSYPLAHVNWMIANEIYMIPKECVIHHIDCDKSNDNPENLILLPRGDHIGLHNKLRSKNKKKMEVC